MEGLDVTQPYWPGRDFPDRDLWMQRRATPRVLKRERVVYSGPKPLAPGINAAKRAARANGTYQQLLKSRAAYRRKRSEQS